MVMLIMDIRVLLSYDKYSNNEITSIKTIKYLH